MNDNYNIDCFLEFLLLSETQEAFYNFFLCVGRFSVQNSTENRPVFPFHA